MKAFDNIQANSYSNKDELERVVLELIPLRSNESKTREYYDKYLLADYRYKVWREDREDCILNGCLNINPQYNVFTHNVGEINRHEAESFRGSLLNVIEDDKYSFAHIYNLLAQETNSRNGMVVYRCVFDSEAIDYAINFDVDELQDKLKGLQDLKEKWKLCNEIMLDSSKHPYCGELKQTFEAFCNLVVDSIKTEASIFGAEKDNKKDGYKNSDRNIDAQTLGSYFSARFKGAGNGNINYFEFLIDDLKKPRSDKDLARIAVAIYESKFLITKPTTFAKWYESFCNIVRCKFHKDYKSCNCKPTDSIKKEFYYLY